MAAQEMSGRRRPSLLALFAGLFIALFLGLGVIIALAFVLQGTDRTTHPSHGGSLGVIEISGLITAGGDSSFLGVSHGAADWIDYIRDATADDGIEAVIIRINSPGGSAAASQEVFETLLQARERSDKPFIASMADLAASGGYYIAAGCDKIVADRATATASIGVVMPGYDFSGLLAWIRVKPETIKSGRFKDAGSGERTMTETERKLFQALVDNTYEQFLGDVVRGRRSTRAAIQPYADGRVMTGEQAFKAKLVDKLGGFYTAVALAQEEIGRAAGAEPELYYYGRTSLFEQLMEVRNPAAPPSAVGASPLGPLAPLAAPQQAGMMAPLWLVAPLAGVALLTGS